MDKCTVALLCGRRGSGKTTLIKTLTAGVRRVLYWDWRGEYQGKPVRLEEVPALFQKKSFTAVYRPGQGDLLREFDALCHVLLALGRDFTFCVDEIALVTPRYREGGAGLLLRYSRPSRINLLYATQRFTGFPGVLKSEANVFYVFHMQNRADLVDLAAYADEDTVQRVAALPPHEHIKVTL